MEFLEIHSILDADSEYHVSFEFEGKIKKLSGDDLPDFQAKLHNFNKKQISQGPKRISKNGKYRFEEKPLANLTMCELCG